MRKLIFAAMSILLGVTNVSAADDALEYKPVQINLPAACMTVQEVDGNNLYLLSPKRPCRSKERNVLVVVGKDVTSMKVFVDGKFYREQAVSLPKAPNVEGVKERAREMANNIKVPGEERFPEAVQMARDTATVVQSEAYQARVMDMVEQLKNDMFEASAIKKFYGDVNLKPAQQSEGLLPADERVYLFISSSMPVETLRAYARTLDKAADTKITMVMRGFIGGASKALPTMEFIAKVLVKEQDCFDRSYRAGGSIECPTFNTEVQIDPNLFTRYRINQVPAVVHATGVSMVDPTASEGLDDNTTVGGATVVYGDAAMDSILETMAEEGKSATLTAVVKRMRKGYY